MMGIRPVLVTDSQPDLPRVACFGQCTTDVPEQRIGNRRRRLGEPGEGD
jgi:hypothetical protein